MGNALIRKSLEKSPVIDSHHRKLKSRRQYSEGRESAAAHEGGRYQDMEDDGTKEAF
jgi:hypothetical protein